MVRRVLVALALSISLGLASVRPASGQATAFSYQGRLTEGAAPTNGTFDFSFVLFSAASGGSPIGAEVLRDDVRVAAGLFTVVLDFGSSPFTSATGNYL